MHPYVISINNDVVHYRCDWSRPGEGCGQGNREKWIKNKGYGHHP